MSKITFRADDDLIAHIESLDASKSEIMRDALRSYLGLAVPPRVNERSATDASARAVAGSDATEPLEAITGSVQGIDVTVRLDPAADPEPPVGAAGTGPTEPDDDRCVQCGEPVQSDHGYCPNCGQPRSRRLVCECGDELRSDWSFCPSCGRRTPTADVLDRT